MLKIVSGKIQVCAYCGEQTTGSRKYCNDCNTQKGRKAIFDENVEIFKANEKLGFVVPENLLSWK